MPCQAVDAVHETIGPMPPSHRGRQRLPGSAWRETSTDKSQRFKSVLQFSTAVLLPAYLEPVLQDKSVRRKGPGQSRPY